MSTVERISREELMSELSQLEKFKESFQTPNAKVQDIWTRYRLLPMQSQHLIASHSRYESCGWSLMTRWQIVKEFDKALVKGENLPKLSALIDSAIATQKKVIDLEKLFAVLKSDSATNDEKIQAFQLVIKENPDLGKEIHHKIAFVYQKAALHPGTFHSDKSVEHQVVKEMLYLYTEGHPRLADHFFTQIGR